ncbi:MAG: hypothetical protein IT555_16260 [Acetobacteraceae bacterium]|nr:hypothetical protein [Acetobacteraceae bacterium]
MAASKTLTAKNLEALGAERLAALLMEIGTGNAVIKRRLRLELAGQASPREVANAVRKRLAAIDRARGFVDWQNRRALVDDLEVQHRAIVDPLAKADPAEALDLMWRFVALANGIFARCDDSSGAVAGVFDGAVASLGRIAEAARADPRDLAERTFQALLQNGYGQHDTLIAALTPALGAVGLAHLKTRMLAAQREPVRKVADADRQLIAWSSTGPIHADELENSSRRRAMQLALMAIADAQGDVDGYIAQQDESARKMPRIAAGIATRLLAAGRADEAWQMLEAAQHRRGGGSDDDWPDYEWEDARIAVMEARGQAGDAQAARWSCFERALSAPHLRAYLKRLPDFEDVEAESRALDLVCKHHHVLAALAFLVSWPALDRAAALVHARAGEIDGNRYEILSPAANALAGRHPLAATVLLRAMIDFTLDHARASRYRHAARHLADCGGLAASIADFGGRETHDVYAARLRAAHGRKAAFWSLVG